MINGILFLEDGRVQVIGELTTARHLITAINTILPQLIEQDKKIAFNSTSIEELEKLLEDKRKNMKLEP